MNIKKSTLVRFFPLIALYIAALITFIFMVVGGLDDLAKAFLAGVLGLCIAIPAFAAVVALCWNMANKMDEEAPK